MHRLIFSKNINQFYLKITEKPLHIAYQNHRLRDHRNMVGHFGVVFFWMIGLCIPIFTLYTQQENKSADKWIWEDREIDDGTVGDGG